MVRIEGRPAPGPRAEPRSGTEWIDQLLQLPSDAGWLLLEPGGENGEEQDIEAQLAIGNGAVGMRAALEQPYLASRPGAFVAGLFDTSEREPRIPTRVAAPDWLRLRVTADGEPVALDEGQTLAYWRALDLRRGVLLGDWRQRTIGGRVLWIHKLRFASLANRALVVQFAQIEVDKPTTLTVAADIQSTPELLALPSASGLQLWSTRTGSATLALACAGELRPRENARSSTDLRQMQSWSWPEVPGRKRTLVRLAAFAHGANSGSRPTERAQAALRRACRLGPQGVVASHVAAWDRRWKASDVEIEGDNSAQRAMRFAVYHLVSAANPQDERVSIGARGLTGEGYLGHVFWDTEIFMLPFFTLTWPAAARAMLMYRFHTLPAARAKAARLGYRGALYAWESADTGEETTPPWALSREGRMVPILCGTQEQHISADVAYAVWQYWQATNDVPFLMNAGAEILLETARFWGSRAALETDGAYHIRGVIGPDEYHESVDDNAYTNRMAAWNLDRGLLVASLLRARWPSRWTELSCRLDLEQSELNQWRDVSLGLVSGFDPATGLFEQFDGFFDLEDVDLSAYAGRGAPLDVVLGPERTRRSQVVKQADVLMLLALLPDEFDQHTLEANFGYYEPRCAHGSSLSPALHALLAARLNNMEVATRYFEQAARIDLDDARADTALGVHMGALGGLWQAAVFGFAGLAPAEHGLQLDPHLPPGWSSLSFRIRWRGRLLRFEARPEPAEVSVWLEHGRPLNVTVWGHSRRLSAGSPLVWLAKEEVVRDAH
jgi:trehalose/maltose hydrolase-like predicted phosphorylase